MSNQDGKKIFISHASKDIAEAEKFVRLLEQAGWGCWIAPRDIVAGENYGEAIMAGIEACEHFLLLFSGTSNDSVHVLREIERALHLKKKLIPVRVEDRRPSGGMDYFLATVHWIDVFEKGTEGRVLAHFEGSASSELSGGEASSTEAEKKGPAKWMPWALAGLLGLGGLGLLVKVWGPDDRAVQAESGWKDKLDGSTQDFLKDFPRDFELTLQPFGRDAAEFGLGEAMSFSLHSEVDAHAVVILQFSDGGELVVFPNTKNRDTALRAGSIVQLPGEGMQLTAAEPVGTDILFAVACTDRAELQEFVDTLEQAGANFPFAVFEDAQLRGAILSSAGDGSEAGGAPKLRTDGPPEKVRYSYAGLEVSID